MEELWHPPTFVAHLAKRLWVHGFLAGLGVVGALFLVWVLIRGTHAPPTPQDYATVISLPQAQPRQASQPVTSSPKIGTSSPLLSPTAVLKTQVEEVLMRVKEANQGKNLAQLLTLYSPSFPELPKKVQEIARSWVTCNYPQMDFLVEEVKPLSDSRVWARVTWNIQVEDLQTKNLKKITRTFMVWFINESGEWRIQSLKKAG